MKLESSLGLGSAESEEEEFFECTSEESTSEEVLSTKTQLKAKHLLWNKPAGRLAKHPTLRLVKHKPEIGRDCQEKPRDA